MPTNAEISERIEEAAWEDLARACPDELRAPLGLEAVRLDEGLILSCPAVDHLLFNRALGVRRDALRDVVRHYEARGIRRYFVQPVEEIPREELEPLGLGRFPRDWVKLVRSTEEPPLLATELPLRRARPEDREAVAAILDECFELPAPGGALLAAAVSRPRWHVEVATDEDRPVAVGALFVDGEVGTLAFGATLPAFRRRGAQGALMAHRIRAAGALGCRLLATETGEPVEDEPSPSYANMLRAGFRPVWARPNYAPRGTTFRRATGPGERVRVAR